MAHAPLLINLTVGDGPRLLCAVCDANIHPAAAFWVERLEPCGTWRRAFICTRHIVHPAVGQTLTKKLRAFAIAMVWDRIDDHRRRPVVKDWRPAERHEILGTAPPFDRPDTPADSAALALYAAECERRMIGRLVWYRRWPALVGYAVRGMSSSVRRNAKRFFCGTWWLAACDALSRAGLPPTRS